jgi:DNA mismatch repair enzyme (predicted ATPase)
MVKTTNFVVEGRLTQLLGENYITVEHALKELVDNAWDADATNVLITLPQSLDDSERFISIADDGNGMSEDAVTNEYMRIARDRVSSKGDRTEVKKRLVKGRKGIGKFAGLLVADKMNIITVQNGVQIQFQIIKNEFLNQHENMTSKEIDMIVIKDNALSNGTRVELNDLIILSLTPNDDKLRQLLVLEYGRESDFNILINGTPLTVEDVGGKNYKFVDDQGRVDLNFNIANKEVKNKQSGIVLRVAGKIIGKPHYWGIEELNYIHDKLLKKVYGEVNADFLEPYTSNSWAILESTLDYEHVNNFVKEKLLFALNDSFEAYIKHTKKKLEREINKQVEKLPVYKRQRALKLIDKVLTGLSDGKHSEQQIKNIIAVTISALENDDYYEIIEKLAESSDTNIEMFADILKEFGLLDITMIVSQATARLKFLEKLQMLADNQDTLERDIHKALEKNMWVFGAPYSMMASNQTTNHIIQKYLGERFSGDRANKRPDLLLNCDHSNKFLLIEFKRPSLVLDRTHEAQAAAYRDDLLTKFPNKLIEIIVIGKSITPTISPQNTQDYLKLMSYDEIILNARSELEWLISNLTKDNEG